MTFCFVELAFLFLIGIIHSSAARFSTGLHGIASGSLGRAPLQPRLRFGRRVSGLARISPLDFILELREQKKSRTIQAVHEQMNP